MRINLSRSFVHLIRMSTVRNCLFFYFYFRKFEILLIFRWSIRSRKMWNVGGVRVRMGGLTRAARRNAGEGLETRANLHPRKLRARATPSHPSQKTKLTQPSLPPAFSPPPLWRFSSDHRLDDFFFFLSLYGRSRSTNHRRRSRLDIWLERTTPTPWEREEQSKTPRTGQSKTFPHFFSLRFPFFPSRVVLLYFSTCQKNRATMKSVR